MEGLLILPLAISVGHCILSAFCLRRLTSRIEFLEERVTSLSCPPPPPPPPPPQVYSQYYTSSPGYGYSYSGGQGNLNVV